MTSDQMHIDLLEKLVRLNSLINSSLDIDTVLGKILEAATEVMEGEVPVRVTLSAGGAAYPSHAVEHEEGLIQLADEALYRAKDRGRDRVEIAH